MGIGNLPQQKQGIHYRGPAQLDKRYWQQVGEELEEKVSVEGVEIEVAGANLKVAFEGSADDVNAVDSFMQSKYPFHKTAQTAPS